jgi:serine/threonine protein kinase/tetratricopeptide (TPR) repeat protein
MQIVSAALQRPAEQRYSYVCNVCGDDPELLQEASAFVRGEEEMGSFLLHPAIAFKESPRLFEPGQVVAERFEIAREIGEGGMGIVYEAFDRKLNRCIAIKAAKPGFQARLSPEIRNALAVSHPNICRVNEIHTARTGHGEFDFLTMEYLRGETLATYLTSRPRISTAEALEIARQICEGLAEAHRRGIVHRDLKTGNVIICRDEKNQLRAVITDFGLAGDGTDTYDLGGTPRYIAPELWKGDRASSASDIYALGVILCDVAGRTRPRGNPSVDALEDSISTAIVPERGGVFSKSALKGMPRRWVHTISRCIDASPQRRPTDANEVSASLKRSVSIPLTLFLVSLLAATTLVSPRVRSFLYTGIWTQPSVRLVVLPPSMSSPMNVELEGALQDAADRISHLKSAERAVDVISPDQSVEMKIGTPEQGQRVLHATHALQTAIRLDGEEMVVTGSVIDVQTRAHLRDFSIRYPGGRIGALPEALAGEVSTALDLRGRLTEEMSGSATVFYDRGLYYLRLENQNLDEAIRLFQKAAQLDQRSALPMAGLVEAEVSEFESAGGEDHVRRAQEYLKRALSIDPDSVRVHLAAGMLNEVSGRYGQAIEEYIRVTHLEPHNVDAFIRIAGIYDKENMPEKATNTFLEAARLDPSSYEPHEYFGVFYFHRGQYGEAAEQFQRVIELAPGMYNAYTNLGSSLEKLGQMEDAERALQNSLSLRETPRALNNMGDLLFSNARFSDALVYLQRAAALTPDDYTVLLNLGDTNRRLGRTKEAKVNYRKAMRSALAELGQNPRDAYARALVGYLAAQLGDHQRSREEIKQSLRSAPDDNSVIRRAVLTYEALGLRSEALRALSAATPDLLRSLQADPDLAEFCRDARFRELVVDISRK